MATGSVDGLVSGLNTGGIINQLLQVEAQPQARLKQKVGEHQKAISAYQAVNGKFATLLNAASALTGRKATQTVKATASSDQVAVSANPGAAAGSFTFNTVQLARAESKTTAAVSSTAAIASVPFTITKSGGSPVTITPTDGTIFSVASAVNAKTAETGVGAVAVKVGDDSYRLQLTATKTGAASQFTVAGITFDDTLRVAGQDAKVSLLGSEIASATNTFTDVMPGVTFTLKSDVDNVTVTVAPDGAGLADKAAALVDAANAALGEIAKYASYDPATKSGGPLLSDFAARQLQQRVLDTVSTAISGVGTAKGSGFELTTGGKLAFKREAFLATFDADPAKLQKLLGPSGTSSRTDVVFFDAGSRTAEGSYTLTVTQASRQASTWADFAGGVVAAGTLSLTSGGKTGEVTTTGTETMQQLADKINTESASKALGLVATVAGNRLTMTTQMHGSAASVTASGLSTWTTQAGQDVKGRFGADPAVVTGIGQLITAPPAAGGANGLSLTVSTTEAALAAAGGTVTANVTTVAGVAQKLAYVAAGATNAVDGSLTVSITGRNSAISVLTKQISNWDVRLEQRQRTLQRQFTGLEVALGKMRDQSNWLSGQIASLPRSS